MSEKLVRVELLADGMRVGDVDKVKGDMVEIPESHARVLESLGSVRFPHKAAPHKAKTGVVKTEAVEAAPVEAAPVEAAPVEADSAEDHDDEPAPVAAPRPRPASRRRGSA